MNQQNAIPPTAHCKSTVAASRAITRPEGTGAAANRNAVRAERANQLTRPYPGAAMARRASSAACRAGALGAAAVISVTLAGCFTGQRPTLADGPVMSGDPAVDAVLERLDATRTSAFSVRLRRADPVR